MSEYKPARGRPRLEPGERGKLKVAEKDGDWVAHCRFGDIDGVSRQVRAQGATELEAVRRLEGKLQRRPRRPPRLLTVESTVADVVPYWKESLDQSAATQDAYRRAVRRHILPGLGSVRLGDIRVSTLDRFLRERASRGPALARMCRTVLRAMFHLVVRDDVLPHNLVEEIKLPRRRKRQVVALTPQTLIELRADVLAWAAARKNRSIMLDAVDLFLATGMRPGELLAVRYEDVDLATGTLHVSGTVKRDSVNGLHRQPHTKTDDGDRILTLPRFALHMIAQRSAGALSDLIFPNRNGEPMEPANFRRIWRQARGENWVHVEPRSFRRAIATLIARERGATDAAAQLGHSSEEVTRKFYIERATLAPDSSILLQQFHGPR
jgi:integrase